MTRETTRYLIAGDITVRIEEADKGHYNVYSNDKLVQTGVPSYMLIDQMGRSISINSLAYQLHRDRMGAAIAQTTLRLDEAAQGIKVAAAATEVIIKERDYFRDAYERRSDHVLHDGVTVHVAHADRHSAEIEFDSVTDHEGWHRRYVSLRHHNIVRYTLLAGFVLQSVAYWVL